MRRLCYALLGLLLMVSLACAANETTTDTVQLLRKRLGTMAPPFVVSGCLPTVPVSSLTFGSFACEVNVLDSSTALVPVTQPAVTVTLANTDGIHWLAVCQDRTSTVSGWTRTQGTHYAHRQVTDQPADPTGCVVFAKATVAGGVITAVERVFVVGGARILDVTRPPYNVPRDGTGNAATEINQALLDAKGGRYRVYLPCGTYRTTAQILLQEQTELFGADKSCAIIAPDTGTSIPRPVLANGVDYTYVHDLQVDCGDETIAGRQGIAGLNGTDYMRVERVHVRRCGQYGLVFGDTSAAPFSSGGAGIEWVDNLIDMGNHPSGACTGNLALEYFPRGPVGYLATPGPLITGNTILAEDADGGIKINNARGARITNNYISGGNCSTATGAIITVASSGVTIATNEIYDSVLGITFGNIPRSNATGGNELRTEMTNIIGNMIQKPGTAGIFSSDGSVDTTIGDNIIRLDGGTGTHGIVLQPTAPGSGGASYTRTSIRNNQTVGFPSGIVLQDDSGGTLGYTDTIITNNVTSVTDGTGFGISVENGFGHTLISNNNIIGHIAGIAVGGAARTSYAVITGNNIRQVNSSNSANRDCIQVVGDYPRIANNYCDNAGGFHAKWGIRLNATQAPLIQGNQFVAMDDGDLVLVNTGSMTEATPMPQAFCVDQSANVGAADTNENTIATCTLPADYFTMFGGVTITAFGEGAGAGGVKDVRLKFGGTTLGSALQLASGAQAYRFEADVLMPDTSVTAQHAWVKGYDGTTLDVSAYGSLAINTTSGTVTILVSCQMANAGDTCRSRGLVVKPWR